MGYVSAVHMPDVDSSPVDNMYIVIAVTNLDNVVAVESLDNVVAVGMFDYVGETYKHAE